MSKINANENNVKTDILNLKKSFFSALDDFKQNYVNYNLYRNVDEYKNVYYTNKEQLQELNSKLYDLIEQIKKKTLQHEIISSVFLCFFNFTNKTKAKLLVSIGK